MRRKPIIATVLLGVVLAGGGVFAFMRDQAPRAAAAALTPPVVPIVAGTVDQHDVPIYLTGVGTVIAYNTDVIRAQILGQIVSIDFTEGQTVHKGDLLAQIDPRPYQALLDQYTANLDRDRAHLVNARKDRDRFSNLAKKGAEPQQLADSQQARVTQLEAIIKSDEALIESAKVQLSFTRLTSSIDGMAGIRQIDIGNIIQPSTPTGLVVVTQLEPISLIFTLPETDLPLIQQQQQKAGGPLKVIAYNQDNTVKLGEGTLALVNNEIIQTTGSIQLKANFPNKDHRLWPGGLVNARLLLDTRHDGLTVPAAAVQQGPNGAYAYVIDPDRTVAVRPVKVAQISDGQALVDAGLRANEQVVIDGQYKLQPGSHVRILHGKAAEEAAAQAKEQAPIP
jgi:multidrug efflux system membrane fusion protein